MLRTRYLNAIALFALVSVGSVLAQNKAGDPISGVGPSGEIKKAHGDFKFVEGPAHDADGNIYFSDIPNEKVVSLPAMSIL